MLVVPVKIPDSRAHVQELPVMEKPAEDPLGNRPRGDQEASGPNPGERLHQGRGAVCRRAVQPGDSRLSRDNRRRKDGRPTGGRRGRRSGQRGLGEQLALLREEEERLGGEE